MLVNDKYSLIRLFFKIFKNSFHHILLLSLPILIVTLLNEFFPQDLMETNYVKIILIVVIAIPIIVVFSSYSTASVYVYIRNIYEKSDHFRESKSVKNSLQGEKCDIKKIYLEVFNKLNKLFFASLLATILAIIGLPTIILTIYFSTIYIFVPYIVIDHYELSVTEQLHMSKKVVKKGFFLPLIIAIFNLLLEISHSLLSPEIASFIKDFFENEILSFIIYILIICSIVLFYYSVINTLLALIYIKNKSGDS